MLVVTVVVAVAASVVKIGIDATKTVASESATTTAALLTAAAKGYSEDLLASVSVKTQLARLQWSLSWLGVSTTAWSAMAQASTAAELLAAIAALPTSAEAVEVSWFHFAVASAVLCLAALATVVWFLNVDVALGVGGVMRHVEQVVTRRWVALVAVVLVALCAEVICWHSWHGRIEFEVAKLGSAVTRVELSAFAASAASKIDGLQRRVVTLEEYDGILDDRLKSLRVDVAVLQAADLTTLEELDGVKRRVVDLEQRDMSLVSDVAALQKADVAIKRRLSEAEVRVDVLERSSATSSAEVSTLKEDVASLTTAVPTLAKAGDVRLQFVTLEKQDAAFLASLSQLQADGSEGLATLQLQLARVETNVTRLERTAQDLHGWQLVRNHVFITVFYYDSATACWHALGSRRRPANVVPDGRCTGIPAIRASTTSTRSLKNRALPF